MNTVNKLASEIVAGDKIVFIGNNNKKVIIGTVDKIYKMVNNELQFRFEKGSNIFSALTHKSGDVVKIAA